MPTERPTQAADPDTWTPQRFGTRRVQAITDPVIEPLWDGDRVLVRVDGPHVALHDEAGAPVEQVPELEAAIAVAARATRFVLDAYVTPQAAQTGVGAMLGVVESPTAKEVTAQLLLGRGRERRRDLAEQTPTPVEAGDVLVIVAVDLLSLEGSPLLDVPLLERRRLLESILVETDLVRIGPYVRPPVDAWLGSWRAQGFRALAYKAANSRYRPGAVADDWATVVIPKR